MHLKKGGKNRAVDQEKGINVVRVHDGIFSNYVRLYYHCHRLIGHLQILFGRSNCDVVIV